MTQTSHPTAGLLEFDGHRGGHLRKVSMELDRRPGDAKVTSQLIRALKLREASMIESTANGDRTLHESRHVKSINGVTAEEWSHLPDFSQRTAVDPTRRLRLSTSPTDIPMRVVDLLCPIGKGQRALIVSPPKAGKTMLMQQLAFAVSTNHPEIDLIVLLVDERPEEVTDMFRTVRGEVFASSSDSDRESHVRL